MNKVNNLTIRIWLITVLLLGFCFIATTELYSHVYQNNIQMNYISDYEKMIQTIEKRLADDQNVTTASMDNFKAHDSHLFMSLHIEGEPVLNFSKESQSFFLSYKDSLLTDASIKEAFINKEDTQVVSDKIRFENTSGLFIFRVKNLVIEGKKAVLYSVVDLSFLNEAEQKMNSWILSIFAVYGLLAVLFLYFLQKNLGEPLNKLRDIAFDYAKNDFNQKASVKYKDELSQLALAMNKMKKSFETTGAATRQEKELLEKIVASISTGILYYNQEKTLLMSNPLGEEFLRNWDAFENVKDYQLPEFLADKIDKVIEKSEKVYDDLMINDFYFQLSLVPLFDEDMKNVRGVLVSLKELTKERHLDKMRVDFISNISHELRTPLVMIQGYSEAIIDNIAETDEEKHEMAMIISDEAKRMNRLVNEMLDLSRMEAGYIDLIIEDIFLEDFFKNILSLFKRFANENHVKLLLEIDPEIRTYPMDGDKMNQVFVNLVHNAIHHSSTTERDGAEVMIRVQLDKIIDEVQMEIVDNGPGILEEDMPYVFDRFYKADKSRVNNNSNKVGTGIGLSIVKTIIEEHGGYIEVSSMINKITTFRIHFPYSDNTI
ncbi:two-component system, OmpR family, sensor histidine kinase ResE [Carnobacterium iners]|uniref:histidine kinase n=1 Tax=Carnobacterium iners TaxID=1073423 RepID=A0A1X7NEW7_9LACT|nr:ATP-binding protein [Carnobacterium iners]SEK35961.1 two-component system, OmpR family, sensor histidine kinase ResE [Carnobacterium iners]SMH35412.1 two-component system, OmpR family, sensor histidine kinase ResE [Carnobacterium iners]